MKRSRRGAHERCTLVERYLVGKENDITPGHGDVFGIAAVCVVTEHQAALTKLIVARAAVVAIAAGNIIVKANSLPCDRSPDLFADLLNHTGHFVSQRHRKRSNR